MCPLTTQRSGLVAIVASGRLRKSRRWAQGARLVGRETAASGVVGDGHHAVARVDADAHGQARRRAAPGAATAAATGVRARRARAATTAEGAAASATTADRAGATGATA